MTWLETWTSVPPHASQARTCKTRGASAIAEQLPVEAVDVRDQPARAEPLGDVRPCGPPEACPQLLVRGELDEIGGEAVDVSGRANPSGLGRDDQPDPSNVGGDRGPP